MTGLYAVRTDLVGAEAEGKRILSLLDEKQKEKINRLKKKEDAARSIAAGILLRFALKDRFGLLPGSYTVVRGKQGKPFLKEYPGCAFNLSHAGEWAVCALSSSEVGVDIEKIREVKEGLARRFFCPEECEWLEKQPEGKKREAFFRLWTLKESYMKFVGKGFSLPLSGFCVYPGEPVEVMQNGRKAACRFKEYSGFEGYRLAACSGGFSFAPEVRILSGEELFNVFFPEV